MTVSEHPYYFVGGGILFGPCLICGTDEDDPWHVEETEDRWFMAATDTAAPSPLVRRARFVDPWHERWHRLPVSGATATFDDEHRTMTTSRTLAGLPVPKDPFASVKRWALGWEDAARTQRWVAYRVQRGNDPLTFEMLDGPAGRRVEFWFAGAKITAA